VPSSSGRFPAPGGEPEVFRFRRAPVGRYVGRA
jgi:hypothetical protein